MRCSLRPRLVNGPLGDPVLLVDFAHMRRALLFDLGDIHALAPRDALKVTHVFVSHTHMDHFCGFDRLLRLCLGRARTLRLYGPEGFLANLAGKLAGYRWDLVANYHDSLRIEAVEVLPGSRREQSFDCRDAFVPRAPPRCETCDGTLVAESRFTVRAVVLAHSGPCLGFLLQERFHVNILKARLDDLGLAVGPWVNRFKTALYEARPGDTAVAAATVDGAQRRFALEQLAATVTRITPGQRIAFVTDIGGTPANTAAVVALADGADQLFIEAAFLRRDADRARRRHHLTAAEAGAIGRRAGVRQLHPMHFSPRYGDGRELLQEARRSFAAGRDDTP